MPRRAVGRAMAQAPRPDCATMPSCPRHTAPANGACRNGRRRSRHAPHHRHHRPGPAGRAACLRPALLRGGACVPCLPPGALRGRAALLGRRRALPPSRGATIPPPSRQASPWLAPRRPPSWASPPPRPPLERFHADCAARNRSSLWMVEQIHASGRCRPPAICSKAAASRAAQAPGRALAPRCCVAWSGGPSVDGLWLRRGPRPIAGAVRRARAAWPGRDQSAVMPVLRITSPQRRISVAMKAS